MRPFGGFIIRMAVSKETVGGEQAVLAILSLIRRIPFPGKTETGWRETGSNVTTTARSDRAPGIGATIQAGVRKDA